MIIRPHPIRQHCLASISALTLLLGLPLAAQETFTFKWQDSDITKKVTGHRPHPILLAATAPDTIKKAPPGLHAPLYGSFAMGPKAAANIGVILDVTADKQQHLFVDANANGDFTDDPACAWAHPAKVGDTGAEELAWEGVATVAIPFANGVRNGRVKLYVAQSGPDGNPLRSVMFHYSDFGWVGEIKLDGKTIPAVLQDGGGAADLHLTGGLMATPLLWLDLPGKPRTVVASRPFDVDGKWWQMANLTADGAFEIMPTTKPAVAAKPAGPDLTDGHQAPPPAAATPGQVLKIGDPAPKLCPGKWLQGEPVAEFAPGTVYVVEFWATWCGPCKASIPHLNELHLKYKDQGLVVIGQDCWERNDAAVEPFVRSMAEHMTYRVAADDKTDGGKGKMANAWMTAAGLNGIPAAFVIDKQGKIAWIGHPMKLDAAMLEEILAGKNDLNKAAAAARREAEKAATTPAGKLRGLQVNYSRQLAASQWAEAEATMDEIDKLAADLQMPTMKVVYNQLRMKMFLAKKDPEGAVTFATGLMNASPHEDIAPILITGDLANFSDIKGPALDYATKLARDGYAKGGLNAKSFTATLARLEMIQGHQDQAVKLQTQALSDIPGQASDATRARLAADLESYKAGKLPAPRG